MPSKFSGPYGGKPSGSPCSSRPISDLHSSPHLAPVPFTHENSNEGSVGQKKKSMRFSQILLMPGAVVWLSSTVVKEQSAIFQSVSFFIYCWKRERERDEHRKNINARKTPTNNASHCHQHAKPDTNRVDDVRQTTFEVRYQCAQVSVNR